MGTGDVLTSMTNSKFIIHIHIWTLTDTNDSTDSDWVSNVK